MGIHIQRQAWGKTYLRNFNKALAEAGTSNAEIDAFRDFIKNEIPTNLGMSSSEIELATWTASTGGPDAVRQLKDVMTVERMLMKSQHAVLAEFPELLPDIRRGIRRTITKNGGLKADNLEEVVEQARNEVVKWPSGLGGHSPLQQRNVRTSHGVETSDHLIPTASISSLTSPRSRMTETARPSDRSASEDQSSC